MTTDLYVCPVCGGEAYDSDCNRCDGTGTDLIKLENDYCPSAMVTAQWTIIMSAANAGIFTLNGTP